MKTPKEKAKELVDIFEKIDLFVMTTRYNRQTPKQCALIAVNETISETVSNCIVDNEYKKQKIQYFEQVKQEIEKL